MNNIRLSNIAIIALIMIVAGLSMVSFDLFRIYRYWLTRKWKAAAGTVTSITTVGVFYRSITFTYSGYEGYARQFKSSQTVLRDTWAENLWIGSQISLRYKADNPMSVLIEHRQGWNYIFFGGLNFLWIILGTALLLFAN